MLGMMNCATDAVEFYSANERKFTSQISEEQTKAFTEIKRKPEISYTQDGRRLIDGKAEKEVSGVQLWHEVIKKSALTPTVFTIPGVETGDLDEEEDEAEPIAVTLAETEPVVAASPKRQTEPHKDRNDEKK